MNTKSDPNSPIPEDVEVRITALLLGELTPEEAAELRERIAKSADLRELYERLEATIGLVKEAVALPEGPALEIPTRARLPDDKREELLRVLRTPAGPGPLAPGRERRAFRVPWHVPMSLAAGFMALLTFIWTAAPLRTARDGVISARDDLASLAEQPASERLNYFFESSGPASMPSQPPASTSLETPLALGLETVEKAGDGMSGETPSLRLKRTAEDAKTAALPESSLDFRERKFNLPVGGAGGGVAGPEAAVPQASFRMDERLMRRNGLVPQEPMAPGKPPARESKEARVEEERAKQSNEARFLAAGRDSLAEEETLGREMPKDFLRIEPLNDLPESVELRGEIRGLADVKAEGPDRGAVELRMQAKPAAPAGAPSVTALNDEEARLAEVARSFGDFAWVDAPNFKNGFGLETFDKARSAGGGGLGGRAEVEAAASAGAARDGRWRGFAELSKDGGEGKPLLGGTDAKMAESLVEQEQTYTLTVSERARATAEVAWQREAMAAENPFSTFSLNVSAVSFKLAAGSLERGQLPEAASIRTEEFINAFHYRDPEAAPGLPIAFAWERARSPFEHNRELLRLSVRTAARGREAGRPLNLVLLLDNSGSMEREDRTRIVREALTTLAGLLQPRDRVSVVGFARVPRLWVDALPGDRAGELAERAGQMPSEGGTNLEEALRLGYDTASRHFVADGINRVVLLTDGAANLGDVDPESLRGQVEDWRKRGVALDCFGVGWEGLNDPLLETLARHGDGRYGFVNSPEEARGEFAGQLAGALRAAAADVKVQIEFNPRRTRVWRQVGYAKHQLTKEQFRDNTVDAAELAAAESGNAIYVVEPMPNGTGPFGVARVRYRQPETGAYREQEWEIPYSGSPLPVERAPASIRLAAAAAAFGEWLAGSPYAGDTTLAQLEELLRDAPEAFAPDARPRQLLTMIQQARRISGR